MLTNQKQVLKYYKVTPNKRLGQNFLLDARPIKQMVAAANITKYDTVIEIGPGLGAITLFLAHVAKYVIAIEHDKNLSAALINILKENNIANIEVINNDALQTALPKDKYKLIGNLPYNCAIAIIMKFLQAENQPTAMVVMLQKEVGQRITAKPPKMNRLAVFCQLYATAKIIAYVKKDRFYPKPKVDSAILLLTPKKPPRGLNIALFEKLVNAGFAMPRKTLFNNLRNMPFELGELGGGLTPAQLGGGQTSPQLLFWLGRNGIKPKQRPQELSLQNWINLTGTFPQPPCPAK